MSTFAYYNFQFAKIKGQPVQGDLFREIAPPVNPDESFARKQEILSGILSADYDGSRPIVFTSPKGGRQYLHHYLAPTTDGVAVMRLSNRRERVVETIDFREEWREEYPSCIVVIDNRPDIQRIVIERRARAFADTGQVCGILRHTFRRLLRPYGLGITIDPLHSREAFWNVANDLERYPLGFRRISFYLPHLNLERLRRAVASCLVTAREVFDGDLSWTQTAVEGGKLNLDENNPHQSTLVRTLMEDVGGDSVITLYPNGKGRKPVRVGEDSYRQGEMDEEVFDRLESPDPIVRERAMDEVKTFTKRYID